MGRSIFTLNAVVTDDPVQGSHRLLRVKHHILGCDRTVLKTRRIRDCTYFHCSEDAQYTRDRVFDVIANLSFEVHAVVLQKNKTNPTIQNAHDLYRRAFSGLVKGLVRRKGTQRFLRVFVAELDLARRKSAVLSSLKGALAGEGSLQYEIYVHPAQTHHMLQVSDYVCWAVARKWEKDDLRSYALVKPKIVNEFDYFRKGVTLYH